MSTFLFWGAVAALIYLHAGYPLLLAVWARLKPWPSPSRHEDAAPGRLRRPAPLVSVLLVACNEAERIDARLANLLTLDHPRDRLDILVASDGSTDDTVRRARAWHQEGVRVLALPQRGGKPAALNALAALARGDILMMADARQRFEPDALPALLAHFDDPRVGAVSGALVLRADGSVGRGVGAYWRLESFIRRQESVIDSSVGVTGAIYAVRRHLVTPMPPDTLLDDVLIPMRVVRQGYRVLHEPRARALDRASGSGREEFTRKVRTLAGNFQLFARERWMLLPWRNRLWLQTMSHKALRLLGPVFLGLALAANVALVTAPFYAALLAAQILFYAIALGGGRLSRWARVPHLAIPQVFCLLHAATLVAFVRFVSGRQRVTWDRAGF
ncbi:MAG: glycosyltransferase family 2 protein [Candidatus Polarisedimenticolia bacterium]